MSSGGGEPSAGIGRGPGHVHAVADDDGARVADDRLVCTRPRDVAALHRVTSIAARAGTSPDRRLARRVRRRGRRRSRVARSRRAATRRVRCDWRPCRSRWRRSRCSSRPRRASSIWTRRRGRRARRSAISSRTRAGCRSRARSRSRGPSIAASTRTRRSACSPRTSRSAPRCRSPTTCARRSAARSASGSIQAATPVRVCTHRSSDVLAIGRELLVPRLVADETRDEMISVQFPGLSGVLPDHGRFDPLDWGLGVQLNTSPPSWMGSRTSPRDVRPLRRLGHVPLGRPRSARRLRCADDARVRRVGEGGVAALLRRGARRARAVRPGCGAQ